MPGSNPQEVFTKQKALIVEGKDEVNFFKKLLESRGQDDIQVRYAGGIRKFHELFPAIVRDPNFSKLKVLSVMRDAESDAKAAFDSVAGVLKANKLVPPGSSGGYSTSNDRKIGVLIIPHSATSGMLEDVCLQAADGHAIMPHVKSFITGLATVLTKRTPHDAPMIDGVDYFPKNESKARVQAFLAGMHEDYRSLGEAAQGGCWNFGHPCMQPFHDFLEQMRG